MSNVTVQSLVAITAITITALLGYYVWHRKNKSQKVPKKWRPVAKVTKIHLYPVKSGRRNELKEADCTKFGLRSPKIEKSLQLYDRSFIIIGAESGEMKTARTYPKMVLIEVSIQDENHVSFDAPGMRSLSVKIPTIDDSTSRKIRLHQNEEIFSLDCGEEAAFWVSKYVLGKETGARLGFHDAKENHKRDLTKTHGAHLNVYKNLNNQSTGLYSDLTAVLLVNQASVDDLNSKIKDEEGNPVVEENFRPNICIRGDAAPPFIEDYWKWIKIGEAIFKNVKPCTRCTLTTINPETGTRNTDREPLRSLEKYRKLKEVLKIDHEGELTVMGANLAVVKEGPIHLDDTVYVNE